MIKHRSQQLINERCRKLEELGLKCLHGDSVVKHPVWDDITFDFSATNLVSEDIIYNIIEQTYAKGFVDGKENLRQMFNRLLSDD